MRVKDPHNFHGHGPWPVYKVALNKQMGYGGGGCFKFACTQKLTIGRKLLGT